jgi:hypothetical protein
VVTSGQRRLNSIGGYAVAECRNGLAYLVYWSPAPGYQTREAERGPARTAEVKFDGRDKEVKMRITCTAAGEPRAHIEQESEEDDHGRGETCRRRGGWVMMNS